MFDNFFRCTETSRIEAVVEFDYLAKEPDELNLKKGNVITDIKIEPGGWWEGTLGGKRGVFPDNFVKVRSLIYLLSVLFQFYSHISVLNFKFVIINRIKGITYLAIA